MMIRPFRPSWELLGIAFKGIHKALALAFGYRGVSSVDKMMEEPPSDDNPGGCGQRNFPDEYHIAVHELRAEGRLPEVRELARWTSHVSGGFFTPYFEPSGIDDSDFCVVVNQLLSSMSAAFEEFRQDYFNEHTFRTFDREERRHIYAKLDDLMGKCLQAREFVRRHTAGKEETHGQTS